MDLSMMTQVILKKIPEAMIPTLEEGLLIFNHREFFQAQEAALTEGFYNLLYGDIATAPLLGDPQLRLARETTLKEWYQVTISGHFNEEYWAWQTFVGMVHLKHQIPNAAMLSMWAWMVNFLQAQLLMKYSSQDAIAISAVLHKLQATVASLIVESVLLTQQEAITRASGLNERILGRFVQAEIDGLLKQGRTLLQANKA